ncbi:MAG: hypothetical protein JWO38_6289 [Gemmataceae bacterium]|nr:hypothetical protein [Gemmataceae bacterium]
MAGSHFDLHEHRLTVRFVQGYRYLDRCGEALINLERVLLPEWLPADIAPQGGGLRNDTLGMAAGFNTEAVSVNQSRVVAFEQYRDQACKIVDVLRSTFQVERVLSPAFACVFQRPFPEGVADEAESALLRLALMQPSPKLLDAVGGSPKSITFTVITTPSESWQGIPSRVTRRIEGKTVHQAEQKSIDQRILRRASMLPEKQRDAIAALQRLNRMHPPLAPVAIEVQLETILEGEIDAKEFPLYDFISEVQGWASDAIKRFTS